MHILGSGTISSCLKEIVPKIEPTPSTGTSDLHFRTVLRRSKRLNPGLFSDIELLNESFSSTPSRKRPHFRVEQRAEEAKVYNSIPFKYNGAWTRSKGSGAVGSVGQWGVRPLSSLNFEIRN